MSTKKLIISGVQLDPSDDLPIILSYDVADVRYPNERGAASSLSVVILGTPEANIVFNHIYDVNAVLGTFNPNKKISARYLVDEVEVFRGSLQLIEIVKQLVGQITQVQYRCYLIGSSADLFTSLRTKFLTDIDFTDLNHFYDYSADKFNPILGQGYCYPYIDYGLTKKIVNEKEDYYPATDEWTFTNLKPAIFEKEYIDRIFNDAGFTYTSNFLNSDYYRHIVIPCNKGGHLKSTTVDPIQNEFIANRIVKENNALVNCTLSGQAWRRYDPYAPIFEPTRFNNEVTDPGNVYNFTTYRATVTNAGVYTFKTTINFELEISVNNQINEIRASDGQPYMNFLVDIMHSTDNGASFIPLIQGSSEVNINKVGQPFVYNGTMSCSTTAINFSVGDILFIKVLQGVKTSFYTYRNGAIETNFVPQLRVNLNVASQFQNNVASFDLEYGGTVFMNSTIPEGITQLDFLKGVIISENLYIEQDINNEKNFIIEPRDQFLNSQPYLNWTSKLDAKAPVSMTPSGNLNITSYVLRQANDEDYVNKVSSELFKARYGQQTYLVDNDFSNKEQVIEPIFAATGGVGNPVNSIVTPAFYTRTLESAIVQSLNVVIRRLYWGGSVTLPVGESFLFYYGNGQSESRNGYYWAGSTDHPQTPTVDLGFGVPKQLFYFFTGIYTTNNRYNARYAKMIAEVTNKQSKLIKMSLILTPTDIFAFTFTKLVFIVDSFYYVNKIINFNPLNKQPTQVELLWLNSSDFTPTL